MPERPVEPPSVSDEDLIEVVMRFAERRGDGCDWDCPAKHGSYCLDGHAEAYMAREILRSRGYA
jgi:hypothetical protein